MRNLSEKTRQRILTETAILLKSLDFSAITTFRIAKTAAISESTLFRYFPQKSLIFAELLQMHSKIFFDGVNQINQLISSPEERIMGTGKFITQFSEKNPDILFIFTREVFFERETALLVLPALQNMLSLYRKNIEQGIRDGLFRSDIEPQICAALFINPLQSIITVKNCAEQNLIEKERYNRELIIKTHKTVLTMIKNREYLCAD
jgi:TetR/AcrR family transcriptional regulator